MKLTTYLTTLLFVLFIFQSCSKEEIHDSKKSIATIDALEIDVKVVEGILHFDNSDDFFQALDFINKVNPLDVFEWEKEIGFHSYYRSYIELLEKAENASDEEYEDLENFYGDDFLFTFEYGIQPKVDADSRGLMSLINKEKIVFVDNNIYSFDEVGQFVVRGNDLQKLEFIKRTKVTDDNLGVFYFGSNATNNRYSNCGFVQEGNYINESSTRKAWIKAKIHEIKMLQGSSLWTVVSHIQVNGTAYKRRNAKRNWRNYRTLNDLSVNSVLYPLFWNYNCSSFSSCLYDPYCTIINSGYEHMQVVFEDYDHYDVSYNDWWGIQYKEKVLEIKGLEDVPYDEGTLWPPNSIYRNQALFKEMSPIKYKHRGTNNHWVELNCNCTE